MATRYISRRYGNTSASFHSRSISQTRELSENISSNMRAKSMGPTTFSRSSTPSSMDQEDLINYYSGYVGQTSRHTRSRFSQARELPEEKTQALNSCHLPTWTSSWRNYCGRGFQTTSQFLGSNAQRTTRLSTPTHDPPRVFIYHKSTVNC